jgi:hypothetical protein
MAQLASTADCTRAGRLRMRRFVGRRPGPGAGSAAVYAAGQPCWLPAERHRGGAGLQKQGGSSSTAGRQRESAGSKKRRRRAAAERESGGAEGPLPSAAVARLQPPMLRSVSNSSSRAPNGVRQRPLNHMPTPTPIPIPIPTPPATPAARLVRPMRRRSWAPDPPWRGQGRLAGRPAAASEGAQAHPHRRGRRHGRWFDQRCRTRSCRTAQPGAGWIGGGLRSGGGSWRACVRMHARTDRRTHRPVTARAIAQLGSDLPRRLPYMKEAMDVRHAA